MSIQRHDSATDNSRVDPKGGADFPEGSVDRFLYGPPLDWIYVHLNVRPTVAAATIACALVGVYSFARTGNVFSLGIVFIPIIVDFVWKLVKCFKANSKRPADDQSKGIGALTDAIGCVLGDGKPDDVGVNQGKSIFDVENPKYTTDQATSAYGVKNKTAAKVVAVATDPEDTVLRPITEELGVREKERLSFTSVGVSVEKAIKQCNALTRQVCVDMGGHYDGLSCSFAVPHNPPLTKQKFEELLRTTVAPDGGNFDPRQLSFVGVPGQPVQAAAGGKNWFTGEPAPKRTAKEQELMEQYVAWNKAVIDGTYKTAGKNRISWMNKRRADFNKKAPDCWAEAAKNTKHDIVCIDRKFDAIDAAGDTEKTLAAVSVVGAAYTAATVGVEGYKSKWMRQFCWDPIRRTRSNYSRYRPKGKLEGRDVISSTQSQVSMPAAIKDALEGYEDIDEKTLMSHWFIDGDRSKGIATGDKAQKITFDN